LTFRMTKAIFFDWFYTLARFEPPRYRLYGQVLQEFGIELSPEKILHGILIADQYFFEENARLPVSERSPEEQVAVFIRYPQCVLAEAGIKASRELYLKVFKRVRELYNGISFALFDDSLSTLKTLKQQGYTLGLITNIAKDMTPITNELGLEPYLDFAVTSEEAGAKKPNSPIFLVALDKAGVEASEAVHVGDHYKFDVVGARTVGIKPILIDRYDLHLEVTDCCRIQNLSELAQYL